MIQIPKDFLKVSVIIATYNYGRYIKTAIDSVLAQTYSDVEIVVVDDGSKDNTRDIVTSYGDSVKYIYQKNRGPAAARNTGIFESKGEFIAFLDADDYYAKDNLKIKMSFLENTDGAGWIFSDWQYVDEDKKILDKGSTKFKFAEKKLTGMIFEDLIYHRNYISPCSVVIKRSILKDIGYFDPDVRSQEELDLWLRTSLKYPVYYIDDVLVYVTVHSNSLSRDFSKWVYGNALIVEKLKYLIPKDFPNRKRVLNRIIADKHTYLGRDFEQKGELKNAMNSYLQSIKQFPFQKRIYWSLIVVFIKIIRFNWHNS